MSVEASSESDSYQFAPDERPVFAGSPFSPQHPAWRRAIFACVGLLTGLCSAFPNALVTVNVGSISGSLGLYVAQVSWLSAIYVAMNASANLTLVKARTQFGIPTVTQALLSAYAAADLLQFMFPGLASAVLIRAISGVTAAGLTTLTVYYLMQVFSVKLKPLALVIGMGLTQLGTPLARMVPVELLAVDGWRGLHLIELGVATGLLAITLAFPLPPSNRSSVFRALDLLTIALIIPAMLLLCGVLNLGRLEWWMDTPWLGWALAAAVALFALAGLIETHRAHPLIQFDWLSGTDILRFGAVALFVRLALAEQTYGAVGLLTAGGLTNDQLRTLFGIVAAAMLAGILTAALTLSERRIPWQVMIAALVIAFGAWIDTDATNLTRPPQLYVSQALLGFGTTLFIGPALVYGLLRVLRRGVDVLVSFVVLFSVTQNVGGLLGSALLGTYQVMQARAHAHGLSEHMRASDPGVVHRIRAGADAVAGVVADSAQRVAEGASLLGRAMTREASVAAYGNVFRFVEIMALMIAIYIGCVLFRGELRRHRSRTSESPA
ncbi:MAG: MFS transporter [Pseudomonadota bacterium]|nr:MFS transporter [Pseudomonadota bacterium]